MAIQRVPPRHEEKETLKKNLCHLWLPWRQIDLRVSQDTQTLFSSFKYAAT
jgi:hypothetical protein